MRQQQDIIERFRDRYSQPVPDAMLIVEREVIGANVGANGYTTLEQANMLSERLALEPGARLLDIGGGRGWPGLYLAAQTGCDIMIVDVPEPALRTVLARADRSEGSGRTSLAKASGTNLPFQPASFDAVVHTDTL